MPIPHQPNPPACSPSPPTLDHFTGQRQVVNKLKVAIEASFADNQPFPHTLLLGPPGLGKTSLAKLVARELATSFHEALGQSMTTQGVVNGFLLKPTKDGEVLFLDEIHEIPHPAGQTALYRAMEENVVFLFNQYNDSVSRLQTAKFSLIAATTDPQALLPPLRDRFKLVCQLQPYSEEELASILRQRCRQLGLQADESCFPAIAQRSFGTPRLAIRLLESIHRTARSEGSTSLLPEHLLRTLSLEDLDPFGLGNEEQKYLKILFEAKGPVRLGVLASKLKVSPRTVSQVVEERLVFLDLIERLPNGRVLSQKGVEHVAALKEGNRA